MTGQDYHKYDRWFMIAKTLLVLAPLVAVGYLQTSVGGSDISQLLQKDPKVTVTFLASMAGPFIAYLLGFAQTHLYEGDAAYMMANLSLILAAEMLLRNAACLAVVGYLMFLVYRMTGMTPLAAFRAKWKDHFFRDLSGGMVLIVFGSFCLFVMLRLGM